MSWSRIFLTPKTASLSNVQFFTLFLAILMPKSAESLSCLQCAAIPNYPTVCPDDGVLDQLEVSCLANILKNFVLHSLQWLKHLHAGLDGMHDLDSGQRDHRSHQLCHEG